MTYNYGEIYPERGFRGRYTEEALRGRGYNYLLWITICLHISVDTIKTITNSDTIILNSL